MTVRDAVLALMEQERITKLARQLASANPRMEPMRQESEKRLSQAHLAVSAARDAAAKPRDLLDLGAA